jgi:hypothetical protein
MANYFEPKHETCSLNIPEYMLCCLMQRSFVLNKATGMCHFKVTEFVIYLGRHLAS